VPTVEVMFTGDDEILTRHKALMLGYYKDPQMTAEIFTADGFIKTGDCGKVDQDGFLIITGRVKDIFKTDKGKYVSPSPIEMRLLKNTDIEQVCVVGMGIPQPIALIILAAAARSKSKEDITKSLSASLSEVNAVVEDYERLKKSRDHENRLEHRQRNDDAYHEGKTQRGGKNSSTQISNLVCAPRSRCVGVIQSIEQCDCSPGKSK